MLYAIKNVSQENKLTIIITVIKEILLVKELFFLSPPPLSSFLLFLGVVFLRKDFSLYLS